MNRISEIHHQDERGLAGRRIAIVLGAVALAVGGGALYVNSRLPHLPDEVASPDHNKIKAVQIDLVKDPELCGTLGAWNTAGSVNRTKVTIPGSEDYLGRGALMEKGKAVDRTCIKADGITVSDAVENGKAVKVVAFERSAFLREVHMADYPDTIITNQDMPGNQAFNGAVDLATGLARIACTTGGKALGKDKVTVQGHTFTCDTLNRVAEVHKLSDAQLKGDLQAGVEQAVQEKGGQASWPQLWALMGDTYKDQAVKQGFPRDAVKTVLVDHNKPTDDAPDFTRNPYQPLYDDGTLTPHQTTLIEFSDIEIVPLKGKPHLIKR